MSDNLPTWTTASTGGRGGWYMSAVTTMRGTACYWTTGEPCVCVQSISFSLMCHWFRVAVLPLDGELAAALLCRGSRRTVCRLRGGLCPQIQPGKILPRLRRAHEENQSRREKAETKAEMSRFRAFQTRINQGFFRGCQRVRDTFILFPRKRRFNA